MSRRLLLSVSALFVMTPILSAADPARELTAKINEFTAAKLTAHGARPAGRRRRVPPPHLPGPRRPHPGGR